MLFKCTIARAQGIKVHGFLRESNRFSQRHIAGIFEIVCYTHFDLLGCSDSPQMFAPNLQDEMTKNVNLLHNSYVMRLDI